MSLNFEERLYASLQSRFGSSPIQIAKDIVFRRASLDLVEEVKCFIISEREEEASEQ